MSVQLVSTWWQRDHNHLTLSHCTHEQPMTICSIFHYSMMIITIRWHTNLLCIYLFVLQNRYNTIKYTVCRYKWSFRTDVCWRSTGIQLQYFLLCKISTTCTVLSLTCTAVVPKQEYTDTIIILSPVMYSPRWDDISVMIALLSIVSRYWLRNSYNSSLLLKHQNNIITVVWMW